MSELSVPDGRTLGQVIETVSDRTGAARERLVGFASALVTAGYLVTDPPPALWKDEPPVARLDPSPVSPRQRFEIPEGTGFVIDDGHFLWFDHDGTLRLRLTREEMIAARPFGEPCTADEAWTELSKGRAPVAIARTSFDQLVVRMRRGGTPARHG